MKLTIEILIWLIIAIKSKLTNTTFSKPYVNNNSGK